MCEFEEFLFNCECSKIRLKSYCHAARNDPNHQCFRVKILRNVWEQGRDCDECIAKRAAASDNATDSKQDAQEKDKPAA
ncbi:hypothetical protein SPI_00433 [Niveomyces insectorum RCEF 264]|uniref:Uncharacterized protein n=1 Tax=Niveomyces insectorum RCEF 264 TaxID=1081102 RepID=A0A168A4J5_9HYPO|nr:hypothetical protein SPI_00433 [Niveomyces insectorum RCEF 264]